MLNKCCQNRVQQRKKKSQIAVLQQFGIDFWRCLAESNRCSRFCRPVPNRSAKAPFRFWDCKYRDFYLNYKFILRDFTPHRAKVLSSIRLRDGRYLRSGHMAGSDGRGYGHCDHTGLLLRRLPERRLLCQLPANSCM